MINRAKNPKVTVIIPTHNRAKILQRTIESVLYQTYQNFELIIVDDGSTDETKQFVSKYVAKSEGKIRYIYQDHKNVSYARNLGIKNAHGQYIAFLDSDDIWLPQKLEKQVEVLDRSDFGFVHTNRILVCLPKNRRHNILQCPQILARNRKHYLGGRSNMAMTILARRDVFNRAGVFDISLVTTQDTDLWLRISKEFDFGYINEPLMISVKREDSLFARDPEQKYMDRMTVYRRMAITEHPLIEQKIWKERVLGQAYALAVEKYKRRKYRDCLCWIKECILTDLFVGRIYFKDNDSWYERLRKITHPYRLMARSLMKRIAVQEG